MHGFVRRERVSVNILQIFTNDNGATEKMSFSPPVSQPHTRQIMNPLYWVVFKHCDIVLWWIDKLRIPIFTSQPVEGNVSRLNCYQVNVEGLKINSANDLGISSCCGSAIIGHIKQNIFQLTGEVVMASMFEKPSLKFDSLNSSFRAEQGIFDLARSSCESGQTETNRKFNKRLYWGRLKGLGTSE